MSKAIRSSDLNHSHTDESEAKKSSRKILIQELSEGVDTFERKWSGLSISGVSAGLDIGFSVLLMAVMATLTSGVLPEAIIKVLMANMYAVGFIFVVIGRSELFTEQTTLAVLPVLDGKAGLAALARVWAIVLGANVLGTAIFAVLVVLIGPALGVITKETFQHIAMPMVEHPIQVMFGSAVLAGWLMGLMSWLVAAAKDTISQIAIVWIVAFVIGIAGLHHSVVGSAEVLVGVFTGEQIGWGDYARFLATAAAGNAVGGSVFVALIKYSHAVQAEEQ